MTFINPTLLAVGLACVAVPIIIHILMRRRRRPVAWGAMRFLLEAYRRQRRRMNLEQILLLASRCLLVALLALAVGKPVLGAAKSLLAGPRTLYLIIDNSLTASARTPTTTATIATTARDAAGTPPGNDALARSKAQALALLSKLDASRGDRAAVIAAGGPADPLVLPATPDLAGVRDVVRSLAGVASRADFGGAVARARADMNAGKEPGGEPVIALLSEFRAGSTDAAALAGSAGPITQAAPAAATSSGTSEVNAAPLRVIASEPATAPLDNVSIVGVDPLRQVVVIGSNAGAGIDVPVRVTLRRRGPGTNSGGVSRVRLDASYAGARTPAPTTAPAPAATTIDLRWNPGQDSAQAVATVTAPAPTGDRSAARVPLVVTATIDNDAIAADNTFRRPIDARDRIDVALLAPGAVGQAATIDAFRAADWLALSLAPGEDVAIRRGAAPPRAAGSATVGDIRVTAIDPAQAAALGRGLADFDAVIVPQPDLVDPSLWRGVRAAADAGSLVVVCPPANVQTHTWTDAFVTAMGVAWTPPREARTLEPRLTIAPDRAPAGPGGADLLAMIAAEIPELGKPVTVGKVLAPVATDAAGAAFDVLLRLADGTPLVVASTIGADKDANRDANKDADITAPRGLIVYLAAAPDLAWTDLPTKPLMVPLMQEIVRQGLGGRTGTRRVVVAGAAPSLPSGTAELARVPLADDDQGPATIQIAAAGPNGAPLPALRSAGLWTARTAAGTTAGLVAVNADPAAGATDLRSKDDLARWLAPLTGERSPDRAITWIGADDAGTAARPSADAAALATRDRPPVSLPLLVAAGVMALVELVLSRLFSHARADQWAGATVVPTPNTVTEVNTAA